MSDAESSRLLEMLKLLLASPTDTQQWANFYRGALPFVLTYGREFLPRSSPAADYEDLAQNVFWLLSRSIHAGTLRKPASEAQLHALLRTIAHNQAKDMVRSQQRSKRDERRQSELFPELPEAAHHERPESSLELGELVEQLSRRLNSFESRVLQLLVEGWGDAELSRELDCSPKKLQRAKRSIREMARKLQEG